VYLALHLCLIYSMCLQARKLEAEEKLSIHSSPLGKDRHHNRYWFFRREGRLFVESADSREWGYYNTKEEVTFGALITEIHILDIYG
jgi:hypothetical protein